MFSKYPETTNVNELPKAAKGRKKKAWLIDMSGSNILK
jgi:hypothetical protein